MSDLYRQAVSATWHLFSSVLPRKGAHTVAVFSHELMEAIAQTATEAGRQVQEAREYLDEWEASYGMDELPSHWGITKRVNDLRAILGEP